MELTDNFIIAMPALADPNFHQAVCYICDHNEQGAMGININHPLDIKLGEVFEQLEIPVSDAAVSERPIYLGGPVETDHGFILHSTEKEWDQALLVNDHLALSTSREIITAIAEGRGPDHFLFALGYAGWGPGQLEDEMTANAWLNGRADPAIIFDTPTTDRWQLAAAQLGVDIHLISNDAGHA